MYSDCLGHDRFRQDLLIHQPARETQVPQLSWQRTTPRDTACATRSVTPECPMVTPDSESGATRFCSRNLREGILSSTFCRCNLVAISISCGFNNLTVFDLKMLQTLAQRRSKVILFLSDVARE